METIKKIAVISILALGLGCGGKKGNEVTPAPAAAQLVFPASDAACLTETQSSGESKVPFNWQGAANTDSYELNIKNLLTGSITTKTTAGTTLGVDLAVNTPYSWSVTSRSQNSTLTAVSATWKFYNAGAGTTSYAPFPATIVSPLLQQKVNAPSNKITLKWSGSDPDNDITSYDIYLGSQQSPALLQSGVAADSLKNVSVSSGSTYYWKVVTQDAQGNTSDSGVYMFSVD